MEQKSSVCDLHLNRLQLHNFEMNVMALLTRPDEKNIFEKYIGNLLKTYIGNGRFNNALWSCCDLELDDRARS